jgi:ethanolamine kinase
VAAAEAAGGLEATLARLSAEANVYALASHIYWGVWSLVQARYSPIDFDYIGYSGLRWAEYRARRDAFLAQAADVFGPAGAAAGSS